MGGKGFCSNGTCLVCKVSLHIWFVSIPHKTTTNVWQLTCQPWSSSSGTTAMIVTKKSLDRRAIIFAELTNLRCYQIVGRRRWIPADWLRCWVLVSLMWAPLRRVSPSKPKTGSGEHRRKSRNGCKILIFDTSRACVACRDRFRSCEAAEYVENVKSAQY